MTHREITNAVDAGMVVCYLNDHWTVDKGGPTGYLLVNNDTGHMVTLESVMPKSSNKNSEEFFILKS